MTIYYFKDRPYEIVCYSKIKVYDEAGMNGKWEDVVIYKTLYHNEDGSIWVRFKEDFETNFKKKE